MVTIDRIDIRNEVEHNHCIQEYFQDTRNEHWMMLRSTDIIFGKDYPFAVNGTLASVTSFIVFGQSLNSNTPTVHL